MRSKKVTSSPAMNVTADSRWSPLSPLNCRNWLKRMTKNSTKKMRKMKTTMMKTMTNNRVAASIAIFILCISFSSAASQDKAEPEKSAPQNKKGDYALIFINVSDSKGMSVSGV